MGGERIAWWEWPLFALILAAVLPGSWWQEWRLARRTRRALPGAGAGTAGMTQTKSLLLCALLTRGPLRLQPLLSEADHLDVGLPEAKELAGALAGLRHAGWVELADRHWRATPAAQRHWAGHAAPAEGLAPRLAVDAVRQAFGATDSRGPA